MARKRKGAGRPERVAFWVTKEIKDCLLAAARPGAVSMGDVCNEALNEYFGISEKPRRQMNDRNSESVGISD